MKHIFIVNMASGREKGQEVVDIINKTAISLNIDYIIQQTSTRKEATDIALQYQENDDVCLYAVGGDGTIFEVLNGLKDKLMMAILPKGSGNDFYRCIGKVKDLKTMITEVINGHNLTIDIALCNGQKFINELSLGMDAKINYDAGKLIHQKAWNKHVAYIMAIIKNLIRLKAYYYEISFDDQKLCGEYYICAVFNGRYYGNGIPACLDADLKDGYLDLCLVPKAPIIKLIPFIIQYLKGKHLNNPHFKHYRITEVNIKAREKVIYQTDGETDYSDNLNITIKKGGLKLRVPPDNKLEV